MRTMKTILEFHRNYPEERNSEIAERTRLTLERGLDIKQINFTTSAEDVRDLIEFWKPDGCIVNNDNLPLELFKGIPTVFCHRNPALLPAGSIYVSNDEREIAKHAARELLSLDLTAYAYVPDAANEYWSKQRQKWFVRMMKINGKKCSVFDAANCGAGLSVYQSALAEWLGGLPRPVGVFAANDSTAATVMDLCTLLGLAIPDDISIIGVDNFTQICEVNRPTLTSIEMTLEGGNPEILEALRDKIDGKKPKERSFTMPVARIVRRASTMRGSKIDASVRKACDLIRTHSCTGLKARDVAKVFPCGRRMAEIRFKAATGQTFLEAIRSTRLAHAEDLLSRKGEGKRDIIANECGYAAWSSVHRLMGLRKQNAS